MTPEIRAARDRLAAVLDQWEHDPLAELFGMGTGDAAMAFKADLRAVLAALDDEPTPVITDSLTYVTFDEDAKATALRDEIERLASERNAAVRERDLWEARARKLLGEKSGRLTPQPDARHAYPAGQCEGCFCCTAFGCHTGPDSTCPTDRLGDSVCPCTGD